MYRKSVDYGQHNLQVVEFSSFRRKTEQTTEITIQHGQYPQFEIKKATNTLVLILAIADLLASLKAKNRKPPCKVFCDFVVENVPKPMHNYQHENTLEQLLACVQSKARDLFSIYDLIANNTITEFVLQCYGRKTIKNYITSMDLAGPISLHGNEDDLLLDYNSQIRGQLLHMLALSFKINACIVYKDPAGQLEDTFKQHLGDPNQTVKLQIQDMGEQYRVTINVEEDDSKVISVSSSYNIMQGENKIRREATESLNTTMEAQSVRLDSRSANKDIRCGKCSGKINCQCDRSTRKPAITRQLTTNTPARSIFDSIGLGVPRRQTSTHDISANKRG